jgi:hypothetical protein
MLNSCLMEVVENRNVGNGKTSFEILSEQINFGSSSRKIVCPKFLVNPTFYEDGDLGPYKQYKFPSQGPNKVILESKSSQIEILEISGDVPMERLVSNT